MSFDLKAATEAYKTTAIQQVSTMRAADAGRYDGGVGTGGPLQDANNRVVAAYQALIKGVSEATGLDEKAARDVVGVLVKAVDISLGIEAPGQKSAAR